MSSKVFYHHHHHHLRVEHAGDVAASVGCLTSCVCPERCSPILLSMSMPTTTNINIILITANNNNNNTSRR